MSIDFIYYPLVFRAGREGEAIPGMQVMQAPAIAHRHRQRDLLAMLLTVSGDHRYDPEEIQTITQAAAESFFQIQGSVTRAMQAVADTLNKQIFDRNLDRGYEGVRALGTLNLAVLHNNWLFLAQVGRTQAVFINPAMVDILAEPADSGDYLGLSKRLQVRLAQTEAQPGDMLLFCEQPPASWTVSNLAGSCGLSMPQVKRRLLNQVSASLETLLIRFAEGRGQVEAGDWEESPAQSPAEAENAGSAWPEETLPTLTEPQSEEPASQPFYMPAGEQLDETPDADDFSSETDDFQPRYPQAEELAEPEMDFMTGDQDESVTVIAGETERPAAGSSAARTAPPLANGYGAFTVALAKTWMKMKAWNANIRNRSQRLTGRFRTAQPSQLPLSPGSPPLLMVILAVAIPLVLTLASLTVYNQSGRSQEHQRLMTEAQQAVNIARVSEDVGEQRTYWAQALDLVTQAQEYDVTQESQALFEQSQSNLDNLDLAGRLDFRPALTQFFPDGVVVSHIEANSSGVYLLDKTSGSVLRISLNPKGFYELDTEFDCAPRLYGLTMVSRLVDFTVLPANSDNFRVMAIDESGNLLYCRTGEVPVSRTLSAPATGWSRIIGAALDDNILYVLDAEQDAIWMFEGQNPQDPEASGIIFSESPIKFLDEDVPDFGGAIDLTVNEEDLYVLHADGHMTLCQYSALKDVKLTECQDPAAYSDNRAGREKKPWIFLDSRFEMLQQTVMPNAAIYILDSANKSIDQFSFQLNLEKVWRPQANRNYPLPDKAPTGFGISSDMEVFLAYDNQLYIAPLN
ncbi:hypothetical protein [Pelolinea submarina]|uniref:Uncharacterized protein n=1 Tax=Pelolinea submarina TaxID=913107 RepID=A0A347ZVI1_9CHLR|nr:hypothetical protein [Pelolinea submarina]REG07009.1 hypothetical protein DFR64_2211 [Pelolinea submarina]BBB49312.1 hypothetical protein Pelsub_P2543 [Pelolinea submarina]